MIFNKPQIFDSYGSLELEYFKDQDQIIIYGRKYDGAIQYLCFVLFVELMVMFVFKFLRYNSLKLFYMGKELSFRSGLSSFQCELSLVCTFNIYHKK